MTPEIKVIISKMLSSLTLEEKDKLAGFIMDKKNQFDLENELNDQLFWNIQIEATEQEEENAHIDEIWKTQYEPFLKGEE